MNKSIIGIIVVVALLAVSAGGILLINKKPSATNTQAPAQTSTTTTDPSATGSEDGQDGQTAQQASNVTIENFAYTPATITVKKGTTVTWTNQDSMQHDVSADGGAFKSELLAKDESFSFTFDEVGTFKYHCTPHPNMIGTVIVE